VLGGVWYFAQQGLPHVRFDRVDKQHIRKKRVTLNVTCFRLPLAKAAACHAGRFSSGGATTVTGALFTTIWAWASQYAIWARSDRGEKKSGVTQGLMILQIC
jgi:hypothetical protein